MSYQSAYTGSQIDAAIAQVQAAMTNGTTVLVNSTQLSTTLNSYSTTAQMNTAIQAKFPVGAVYITSTNATPGTYLGGTWSLIDKEFKYANISSYTPTLNSTNCTSASVAGRCIGHTVYIQITDLTPKVALNYDTKELFTISPSKFGCSGFLGQRITFFSDGQQTVLSFSLNGSGVFSSLDYLSRGGSAFPASSEVSNIYFEMVVPYSNMNDSACDKFYWKRTA